MFFLIGGVKKVKSLDAETKIMELFQTESGASRIRIDHGLEPLTQKGLLGEIDEKGFDPDHVFTNQEVKKLVSIKTATLIPAIKKMVKNQQLIQLGKSRNPTNPLAYCLSSK